jgi:hypothetical protein
LTIRWNGKAAQVNLMADAYSLQADYLAFVESVQTLRNDLLGLESRDCIGPNEGQTLVRNLVEQLPLPPEIGHLLRFGSTIITKGIDLSPGFRLSVTSPIYADGAVPSTESIVGYEAAEYSINSARNDGRVKISLSSVTETLVGMPPVDKSTTRITMPFPESYAYSRLLVRYDASTQLTIATVVSASDMPRLNEATRNREFGPSDVCQSISVPGVACMSFPPRFGVTLEMLVHVNGMQVPAETVWSALNLQGTEPAIPESLVVRRPFRGRLVPIEFDRTNRDILRLPLTPEDEITY